ncbi:MAG: tyrosine-type recombinase/integrase [Terriglobia bacterium]
MNKRELLGPWIRRFLLEYIVKERNLSVNTQRSYRDTLRLLLPFLSTSLGKPLDQLNVGDLSANLLRLFLRHLEDKRNVSAMTRNQRLAAIHSVARFIAEHSPEHVAWCGEVRTVHFKKTARGLVGYLDKPEIEALLSVPDRTTPIGQRNYALLLFLYNSGARVSEVADLSVEQLDLGKGPHGTASVTLLGKGAKQRRCPLWNKTAAELAPIVEGRPLNAPVFLSRHRKPFTRFGIYNLVTTCAAQASKRMPSLLSKRITPHTLRHSTATHLLRSGVDINTIRAWLGHVSLDTTQIYAEIDLEMKTRALEKCDTTTAASPTLPHAGQLMDFLQEL